jgi:hypothetical protein
VAASESETPCSRTFASAFFGSQSTSMPAIVWTSVFLVKVRSTGGSCAEMRRALVCRPGSADRRHGVASGRQNLALLAKPSVVSVPVRVPLRVLHVRSQGTLAGWRNLRHLDALLCAPILDLPGDLQPATGQQRGLQVALGDAEACCTSRPRPR